MIDKIYKVRNYSFQNSRRLPISKMTEINGIRIPSMPGSCYHAILCTLSLHKNKLVLWDKIFELTEKYMKQYGGEKTWEKFKNKDNTKPANQRIKENVHTLTRTGKDCYGYRLHEKGMAIYFFKDGAMLLVGGNFEQSDKSYTVTFPDGRGLQVRYRGNSMSSQEYKRFLELGYITINGEITDLDKIRQYRLRSHRRENIKLPEYLKVSMDLGDSVTQQTAERFEGWGLKVHSVQNKTLLGRIPADKLSNFESDKDVISLSVL